MRTKTLLAAAAMLAAGFASSMAQSNVYSLNVVGYVNKVLVGLNHYTAAANPLNTPSNSLFGVFGGPGVGLPTGTRVYKWPGGQSDFTTYTKTAFGDGWAGNGAVSMRPGEGCLILTVVGSANVTNTFVGEVMQGNLINTFVAGYQLGGNMVPDSGSVTNLGFGPPTTSRLLKWDSSLLTQGDWVTYTKTAFGSGWSHSPDNLPPNLDVAEGFLLFANPTGTNWVRNFTVQ